MIFCSVGHAVILRNYLSGFVVQTRVKGYHMGCSYPKNFQDVTKELDEER